MADSGPIAVAFPESASRLGHIFRQARGHVLDTPFHRNVLLAVANDVAARLGSDHHGNMWAASMLEDGRQAWVQIRGGLIVDAGINDGSKPFHPRTGLKKP